MYTHTHTLKYVHTHTHGRMWLLRGRGTAPSVCEPVAVTFKIDYKEDD